MRVLAEHTAKPVSSAYVEVDDSLWIDDRDGDGTQWRCLAKGLVGSVLVVELFVLA
ncbi:hypothetical protein [Nonomuraea turcica]|uniref:hypothetical protein n=1 Tax=Nonomuraea sp. G32 TaxID=3067274 RepID=UPI00273AF815|nr:hypothetical protein [Nonomuraea sp. G32]MDP4511557.1 hypothetical protein [Nonomuraea sp. G32]